jgi:hypothetical protein
MAVSLAYSIVALHTDRQQEPDTLASLARPVHVGMRTVRPMIMVDVADGRIKACQTAIAESAKRDRAGDAELNRVVAGFGSTAVRCGHGVGCSDRVTQDADPGRAGICQRANCDRRRVHGRTQHKHEHGNRSRCQGLAHPEQSAVSVNLACRLYADLSALSM